MTRQTDCLKERRWVGTVTVTDRWQMEGVGTGSQITLLLYTNSFSPCCLKIMRAVEAMKKSFFAVS